MDPLTVVSAHASPRSAVRRAMTVVLVAGLSMAGLSVVVSAPAWAQTTGGWTQFQGDGGHTGYAPSGPEPGFSEAWSAAAELGGPDRQYGLSAPVVAGDVAIAVAPDRVLGFGIDDGGQAWSVDRDLGPPVPPALARVGGRDMVVYTEGFGTGPPQGSPSEAPSATPSASATPSDAEEDAAPFDSHVAAFDLKTREPLWDPIELDAVSRTGVVVDGEKAFFGVNGGTVYAVDLADGRVAWTTELNRVVGTPLAVSDGAVVVGLQASSSSPRPTLVALDAEDGKERWRIDDEGAAAIVSTATIAGSTVFAAFSGGQESSIDAIDLDSGARSWRTRFSRFFDLSATAPPVVTDEAVFVVDTQGEAYRLDRATGHRVWEFALNEGVLRAAPVATGAYLVVAPIDGSLVALEASTGDLVWRGEGDGFPIRAVAVAGDLLVAVRSGPGAGLVAFGHDPSAALVREVSPTHVDLARLAGSFVVAALAMVALMVLAGRYLAGRMGLAFPTELPDPDTLTEEPGEGEDAGGAL